MKVAVAFLVMGSTAPAGPAITALDPEGRETTLQAKVLGWKPPKQASSASFTPVSSSVTVSRVGRGGVGAEEAVTEAITGACEPQVEVCTVTKLCAELSPVESVTTTLNW